MSNTLSFNIYAYKAEGKPFWRLYDGAKFFAGNHNHHACVASNLTEEEAYAAVLQSKLDPVVFATEWIW